MFGIRMSHEEKDRYGEGVWSGMGRIPRPGLFFGCDGRAGNVGRAECTERLR